MYLMVIIIKEEEKLEDLLHHFREKNVSNITVLQSISEVRSSQSKMKEPKIFGSLRFLKDYYSDESRVILHLGSQGEIEVLKQVVREAIHTDEYVFFTVAVSDFEGNIQ